MTDRERWTVYPLLFLALGISLKDKLTRSVNTDEVRCKAMVCNELLVARPQSSDVLRVVGGNLQAKSVVVADANGVQRIQLSSGSVQAANLVCNALVVAGGNGKEAVTISSNDHGGFVRTTGVETGTISFLGNTDRIAGLLFIDAHGAIHPGPIFASPIPAKKPAVEESPAADAAPSKLQPEEGTDAPPPSDANPEEKLPADETPTAQPK